MKVRRDVSDEGGRKIKTERSGIEFNSDFHPSEVIDRQEAWREGDADIKAGRDAVQKQFLTNHVSEFASNPRQYIADMMDAGMLVPKVIKNLATEDVLDFELPTGTQRRIDELMAGLQSIRKGLDKKMKAIKKQRGFRTKNHPEWYGKYPDFITSNLNWGVRKEAIGFPVAVGYRVIMKLTIPHKDGVVSQAYKDAINAIFVKVRGSNSGAFNYTAEDIAAYIECVRSIIGLHTNLVRDMHAVNNVDPYIARTPDGLLSVLGYDAAGIADMKNNQANYVAQLNQLKNAIEVAFPLMPDLAVLDRTKFIAKAILEEGKGPKSSVFAYYLDTVAEASTGSGNEGKIQEASTFGFNMPARIAILTRLINSAHGYVSATYTNYDTFAKIAGDIMKAYGNQGFYQLDSCSLTGKAEVQYDEYMLHQLQNTSTAQIMDAWTAVTATAPFSVAYSGVAKIPGDGTHTYRSLDVYGMKYNGACAPIPVNTDKKDVNGLEAISLTRNAYLVKSTAATHNFASNVSVTVDDCHADLVAALVCYHFKGDNSGFDRITMMSTGRSQFALTEMSMWAQVDYSPCIQVFDDANNNSYFIPMLDIDTYALMTKEQLQIFNDTCVLSLYKTVGIQDQVNFRAVKR